MAHHILRDDPAAVAFRAERDRLEADRKKAVAEAEQKQAVFNESNSRALAEGAALPGSAPETVNQVNQGYAIRGARRRSSRAGVAGRRTGSSVRRPARPGR